MISKLSTPSSEIVQFLAGCVGVVDANSYEYLCLWKENKADKTPLSWVQNPAGYLPTIGFLDDRPVCLSLLTSVIDGFKLLFVDPTSQLVDHKMIGNWLNDNMPKSAFQDGRLNRTNAMNFCNVFPNFRLIEMEV